MKISVVIASLNRCADLEYTLCSVFSQENVNVEAVVIDGDSTDGTAEMLCQMGALRGDCLRWLSEPDAGIYNAMNKGIRLSTGDIVGFLGAGDVFADSLSLHRVATALQDSTVEAVHADLVYVDPADRDRVVRVWRGQPYIPGLFRSGWQPAHPTFYVRRKCFDIYGGFDESLAISADFDLMLRFLEIHRLNSSYLPVVLVKMLAGGASNGSLRNIYISHKNIHKSFRKNQISPKLFYTLRRLLPKLLNTVRMRLG